MSTLTSIRRAALPVVLSLAMCLPSQAAASPAAEAGGQAAAPAATMPADAIREDLRYLCETLAAGHCDLFAHRDRSDYDALFERLLASVERPRSRREAAAVSRSLRLMAA